VQFRADYANGRFKLMEAGLDPAEMRNRGDHSDGAVAAHTQITDIVEKDNTGHAARFVAIAEQRSDHGVRPARLIDNCGTVAIEACVESLTPVDERASAKIGAAGNHHACRFSACVRINHTDIHGTMLIMAS
jgi:hypothetical protein